MMRLGMAAALLSVTLGCARKSDAYAPDAGASAARSTAASFTAANSSTHRGASATSTADRSTDTSFSSFDLTTQLGAATNETSTAAIGSSTLTDAGPQDDVSCDPRKVVCKAAEPRCDYGFVPRIVNGCYDNCVAIDTCVCDRPEACPQQERYTCNNSRRRCTPYLN